MKLTPSIIAITLSLGAASAFGFKTSSPAGINVRSNAPFVGRENAMVQHIGVDGRMNVDDFVSICNDLSTVYCIAFYLQNGSDYNTKRNH